MNTQVIRYENEIWATYVILTIINPQSAKLNLFIFYPFEVVSRYRDPQLQVAKKYT